MMPERGKSEAIMGYTITPTELKSRLDKGDQGTMGIRSGQAERVDAHPSGNASPIAG
jgi:hypothetical protein